MVPCSLLASSLHQLISSFHCQVTLTHCGLLLECSFSNFFFTNLFDQHGKIISRDELEKILAKEKTEELEVENSCQ